MATLTGTNRGKGGLAVAVGSDQAYGVDFITFSGATLTNNGNGRITLTISGGGGGGMSSFTIAGASGSSAVSDGQTVTVTGSGGITTNESSRTVTVSPTGVLEDLNTLGAPSSDGEFIVATGAGAFAYETGTTVRASLGLGTMATQNADAVAITGGVVSSFFDASLPPITAGGFLDVGDLLSGYVLFGVPSGAGQVDFNLANVTAAGFQLTIVNTGTTNPVNINANGGGQTINGVATVSLNTQYNAVSIVTQDGSNFVAIGV